MARSHGSSHVHHRHAVEARDDGVLRIGLAIPLSGSGGIFASSCEAVAQLCAEELNEVGVAGNEVRFELIDASLSPESIAFQVDRLIDQRRIDALTGWHISSVREAVAPVTTGRIPYVYTSLYEGGERRPGVFCVGETPARQIEPGLRWVRDVLGARRWYVVGADYVWPLASSRAAVEFADALDLEIVGRSFVRFGTEDFTPVMQVLERSAADAVMLFLVGQDAVEFNRAFAARGLHDRFVRFSPLMEENMLLASGAAATENLYVCAGYFRSLVTAGSLDFVGNYVDRFGPEAPALNNQAESCYEGITLLARLIDAAKCTHVSCLQRVSEGVGYDGPRGPVMLSGRHLQQPVHLARADGLDFEVLTAL